MNNGARTLNQPTWFRRFVATVLASLLALTGIAGAAPAAYADTPSFSTSVEHNGSALADGAIVEPGETLTFTSQYTSEVGAGAEVVIGLPDGVTLDGSTLESASNEALESVTQGDRNVVYTFGDPLPEDFERESHSFQVTIDEVEATEDRAITWSVNGADQTRQVTVEGPVDEQQEEASEAPAEETPVAEEPAASEAPVEETTDEEEEASDSPSEPTETSAPSTFDVGLQEVAGFNATVLHNESPLEDGAIVQPGDTFTFNTQYTSDVGGGTEVVLGVPEGVSVPDSALVVPVGNTAIESIVQNDAGDIVITFVDPLPTVQEGVHGLDLTFDQVEFTESRTIEWTVAGTPSTRDIIMRAPEDSQENVSNSLNKSASGDIYAPYVSVDDGEVVLSEDITDRTVQYTLTIDTEGDADRSSFDVSDQLSEYLVYNDDSFSGEITTWDTEGWNRDTNPFDFDPQADGNGFSTTLDIPSPSQLELTYTASPNPDLLDQLRDELQDSYQAMDGDYGGFSVMLGNTADLGGDVHTAEIEVGLRLDPPEGPGIGEAFDKNANWWRQVIEPAEDGTLEPPLDVTYTFSADLSAWDGREDVPNEEDFVLDRNVVISDSLPTQAEWNTTDDDFITAEGMDLTQAADFDGDADAFAATDYVGQYAVVDQNLYINIGQESDTNVTVDANALIHTIDGLSSGVEDGTGFTEHYLDNDALFTYSNDETPYEDTAWLNLIDRGDTSGGVNVPNRFSKNVESDDPDDPEYVAPGESATIDYSFVVNGSQSQADAVDVTNSYIVDERDPNIFDLSDLEEIRSGITGQYAWDITLGPEHFDVSTNDEGNLVLALSETGVESVVDPEWMGVDNRLEVNIPLTTHPITGKQTITVENSATLYGEDEEALYWSETSSEASSFGSESEVRKTIRDTPNTEWTQNLRVEVGDDGELVQDQYVYNLAYIAHGSFTNLESIDAVHDALPDNLDFVGFVTDGNVDTGEGATDGPVGIGGNLEAFYDEDAHTVTVHLPEGEFLVSEEGMSANVLVSVNDFTPDVPVANMFGSSTAIFTPSDGYPLSIAKVDSEDQEVVINDPDSRFQILDADENVVIEDAFVENGQLRALDDEGDVTGLVVRETGTYYVEESVAPEGYELSEQRIQVTVDEDGSSSQVTFPNIPADEPEPEPEVEIIKGDGDAEAGTIANDANTEDDAVAYEDGETRDIVITVENTGTEDLEDVVLTDETTSGVDIQDLVWTLPNGETVDAEEADGVLTANWDGPWAVGDEITGVATLTLAEGEELHTNLASVQAVGAGSGTPVEDEDPYNATPPEPAPTFAVGDYVWIDSNGDGVQDEDEDPLEDVTVVLYDGDVEEVSSTSTDEDGRYIFDELDAGEYQVQFVLTEEQAELYEFTSYTSGEDSTVDSNAGEDGFSSSIVLGPDNGFLTSDEDYQHDTVEASEGIDPTWDAGVVLLPEPEEPSVSVGDYVWIDEDGDGIQDDDEPGIPGVVLEITGPEGEPVTDVNGDPVGPTTTDEEGFYTFEDLPVLEEGQSYTVTINQDESEEALEGYEPTLENEGDDPAVDSSTWSAESTGLTEDGDRDPTLDFGFIVSADEPTDPEPTDPPEETPSVSVGDYVWVDEDGDGIQDDDEPGIPGVVLEITGPDGEPVTDVNGEPVGPVTTDEDGRYIFENLPVLEEDESYTVTIDQEASAEALAGFEPTLENEGDRDTDSSTWVATTLGLTQDGEQDLTLDFGFVLIPEDETASPTPDPTTDPDEEPTPTDPADPEPSPEPNDPDEEPTPTDPADPTGPADPEEKPDASGDDGLAITGSNVLFTVGALVLLLLLIGGGLLAFRRYAGNRA